MIEVEHNRVLVPENLLSGLVAGVKEMILENVAQSARNHWIRLAGEDSSSMRGDYINGIQEVQRKGTDEVSISLVGEVPHMLEDGTPQTDLRDVLLNPAKVKVVPKGQRGMHATKAGAYYRYIPFRHTVPGSGNVVGQTFGKPYAGVVPDWKAMGRTIYAMAKEAKGSLDPGAGGAFRLRNPTTKALHFTDIYAGLRRLKKETGTQYMTWRTISTATRNGTWIRGQIRARHYARQVAQFAATVMEHAIASVRES